MSLVGRSFLHASDLHIGSPLGKLERCPTLGQSDLQEVTRLMQQAFDNMVTLAIEENVVFVVLSGDVYDGADAQDSQQGIFQRGLERLAHAGINVYIALGNHDPKRAGFNPRKPYPPTVTIFETDQPHEVVAAQDGDLTIKVAGVSYGSHAVRDNLAERFTFPRESGTLRVGVLHTSLAGHADHETYAPCTVDDLTRAHIDYWALGHIHLRSVSPLGPGRWYAYPGNLQGRSFKPAECHPKGVLVVPIEQHGFGRPEFRECDTVRFADLEVDVSGCAQPDETYRLVADVIAAAANAAGSRKLVTRVRLTGRSTLHRELSRAASSGEYARQFLDSFADDIGNTLVAGITSEVRPDIDPASVRLGDSLLATSLRRLDSMTDDEVAARMDDLTHPQYSTHLDTTPDGIAEFRRLVEQALIEVMEP